MEDSRYRNRKVVLPTNRGKQGVVLDPTHNLYFQQHERLEGKLEFADSDIVSIEGTGSKTVRTNSNVNTIRASLPEINLHRKW